MKEHTFKVLSIDAWVDSEEGWTWNAWYNVGEITIDIDREPEYVLDRMMSEGFIRDPSLADVEDDQYNLVIVDKLTREPVFAIEYGSISV